MAVGSYNDSIWLIGGGYDSKQSTEFKVNTQIFTNYRDDALSSDVRGHGQFWSQQDHVIYIIDKNTGNSFCIYDLMNNQFTSNWMNVTFSANVGDKSCLSSTPEALYVTGGLNSSSGYSHNILQIVSLSSLIWVSSPPNMNMVRRNHACIVHNNYLWAIGGFSSDYLKSIERILITNIMNNEWMPTSDLSTELYALRVVARYDTLYVIGGWKYGGAVDIIHLIDANTGLVNVSSDPLPYPTAYSSPIIYHNIFYVFGGIRVTYEPMNRWAYYPLPPIPQPTSHPSDPSHMPSLATLFPSNIPTVIPTGIPTFHPRSFAPTTPRTDNPSNIPTVIPISRISTLEISTNSHLPLYSASNMSITVRICEECVINTAKDDIGDIILIAFEDDAMILSADIVHNNELLVILRVIVRDDEPLDVDMIEREIEMRLKDNYGEDIQVEIERDESDDDGDGNEKDDEQNETILHFVSQNVLVLCIALSICCIASIFAYKCLPRWRATRLKQVELKIKAQHNINIVTPALSNEQENDNKDDDPKAVTNTSQSIEHQQPIVNGIVLLKQKETNTLRNDDEVSNQILIGDDEFIISGDDVTPGEFHHGDMVEVASGFVPKRNKESVIKEDNERTSTVQ
eukprot:434144_1